MRSDNPWQSWYRRDLIVTLLFTLILIGIASLYLYTTLQSEIVEREKRELKILRDSTKTVISNISKDLDIRMRTVFDSSNVESNFLEIERAYRDSNSTELKRVFSTENPFREKQRLYSSREETPYSRVHSSIQSEYKKLLDKHTFQDILFLDLNGRVIYSFKKFNFGEVIDEVYRASELLKGEWIYFDSYRESSVLGVSPVVSGGVRIGYVAISTDLKVVESLLISLYKSSGVKSYLAGEDYRVRAGFREGYRSRVVNRGYLEESGERSLKKEILAYSRVDFLQNRWVLSLSRSTKSIKREIKERFWNIFLGTIVPLIALLIGVVYLIFKKGIQPILQSRNSFGNSIQKKSRQLQKSIAFLEEYKRAVDQSSIVSKANRQGVITYINESFLLISGYRRDELIGKPHSIVRHPDMPNELFRDIWNTISHKRVWKGVIKNRRKDGRAYYVNSTIIPMLDSRGRIREYISIRTDVTELIEKDQLIVRQTTDRLTKLPNREKLLQDIEESFSGSLATIKVMEYQEILEFYGSDCADNTLLYITTKLQEMLQDKFRLYRVGRSRFVLYLSDETIDISEEVGKMIGFFDHNFVRISSINSFNLSLSAGISSGDRDKLLYNSEIALQSAVENRINMVYYNSNRSLGQRHREKIGVTTQIKSAINEDRVTIFVQEIAPSSPDENHRGKYEVLVRIMEDNVIISPVQFLEVAKRARLYPTITKIVIDKAIALFQNRREEFSINLSIEDIADDSVMEYLKKRVKESGVGDRIIFEIVESEEIVSFEPLLKFFSEMRAIGCRMAIDDFGSGYSNYEYLLRFKPDFIKIDGSLIKEIDRDKSAKQIVEMIVVFAKSNSIETVAEYVSSQEILNVVKSLGIDYFQGYLIGKPKSLL
jgi:PAS domain S-box-containing protein